MMTMKRIFQYLSAAALSLLFAGCYNDFDAPAEEAVYTDADLVSKGLTYISIRDLKEQFWSRTGAGAGSVASWAIDEPLYTRGKVISTDRYGSLYKSLYLYDESSESAIELKITTGNYLFYPAGRELFVELKGLVLGNYRGMVSIGAASANSSYSNDNLEVPMLVREHLHRGEELGMTAADTQVIDRTNYATLTDDALGRLVRFEGIESVHGKAKWGYQNNFPNYFANSTSYDRTSEGELNGVTWADFIGGTPTWAAWGSLNGAPTTTYFYGSAWFSYDKTNPGENTAAAPGNYVVRTSGYAQFRGAPIPADGATVDLTAIYTKYTNTSGRYITYQLVILDENDVVLK